MSKYAAFELDLCDEAILLAALAQLGYAGVKVQVNQVAQTLMDYHGHARPEKAHVVIPRRHTGIGSSNDIGFFRQANGKYTAIVSEYDQSALKLNGKPFIEAVNDAYCEITAQQEYDTIMHSTIPGMEMQGMIPMGYTVEEVTVGDTVQLVLRY